MRKGAVFPLVDGTQGVLYHTIRLKIAIVGAYAVMIEERVNAKRMIRSDGLLMVCIVVGIALFLWLAELAAQLAQQAAAFIQAVLYLAMIVLAYILVRKRLSTLRYVLTEAALIVYRETGRREVCLENVALSSILFVVPYDEAPQPRGREYNLSVGRKAESLVVAHQQNGGLNWLLLSPSPGFVEQLQARAMAVKEKEPEKSI